MERTRRRLVLAILVITGSGCSVLPVASPSTVVGAALDAVADHDLARANAQACPEARDVTRLPCPITGIVLPLGSIADLPMDRALEVVTIELGDLQATESVDGDQAQVRVTGAFGLQFDPSATRALLVDLAPDHAELDATGTDRIMAVVGAGSFKVSADLVVPLERRDGAWLICQMQIPGDL